MVLPPFAEILGDPSQLQAGLKEICRARFFDSFWDLNSLSNALLLNVNMAGKQLEQCIE